MKPDIQSDNNPHNHAVIYCRSASANQLRDDDCINAQEKRCREFAKQKNYDIVKIIHEKGFSGDLVDRQGVTELLSFLKTHKNHSPHIVIIDDISRLARRLATHTQLKKAINDAGGILESPSFTFSDDPDSRFMENMLAIMHQHQDE